MIAAGAVLAACQPVAPPPKSEAPQAAAAAPKPPEGWETAFPNCTWGEVKGGGASIWAFACPNDKIVFDAALPGFAREISGENAAKGPIVQFFTKAADAPIESVLPAIRAASSAPADCALEQVKDAPAGEFQLMPTGQSRQAYDRLIAPGGPEEGNFMPCGALGPSEAGRRVIKAVPDAPTLVAVIHIPSDIPTFDETTLRGVR
jgi:hypothetical protein